MLNGIHGHQDIERVVYGKPAGPALRAEAERLGARRVFVTTSKSVAQSALLADVIRDLGDRYAGVYSGITAAFAAALRDRGRASSRARPAPICIVAVGGGSAIDATKVMLIALWQNATTIEDLDLYRAGRPKEGAAPPSEAIKPPADAIRMIAVPTTLVGGRVQRLRRHQRSAPRHQGKLRPSPDRAARDRARSRGDAGHADGPHAVDRAQGRRPRRRAAVLAAGPSLRAGHGDRGAEAAWPARCRRTRPGPDDMETRLDLQFGMWLSIGAGTSGVGVGASHGIGHVLGAACHVPHGHTSCVMLPSVLRWNLPANAERQKRVSEAFGKPGRAGGRSRGRPGRRRSACRGGWRRSASAGTASARSPRSRCTTAPCSTIRGRSRGPAEVMEILELAA